MQTYIKAFFLKAKNKLCKSKDVIKINPLKLFHKNTKNAIKCICVLRTD
jgi:hypothetical protein